MADITSIVALIRHAQDESARAEPAYHPRPDSPLTQYGAHQARSAAGALARDYAGIVYSPILRAERTARILSEASGIPLLAEMPLLSEWRPPSCVYGKTPEDYDEGYRTWRYARSQNPYLAYEDGESLADLHARATLAAAEMRRLADEYGPLLAVSHKVFLGVLTYRGANPAGAFQSATKEPWRHCEIRQLADNTPAD